MVEKEVDKSEAIESLINAVSNEIIAFHDESVKSGNEFNILKAAQIESNEVRICRVLRELLDPKGSHGQEALFLKLFIAVVCDNRNMSLSEKDFREAKVKCEEYIDEKRRIDIVIHLGKKYYLPFEVKLYAGDQKLQLKDYYEYARKWDAGTVIYYLTLDGKEPSDDSKKGLNEDRYICLSFAGEILSWLDACIKAEEIEQKHSLRISIIQFRDTIRDLTGMSKRSIEMKTEEIIKRSPENIKAALRIEEVLKGMKDQKKIEIINSIKKYMSDLGFSPSEAKEKNYRLIYSIPALDGILKLTIGIEANQLFAGIKKENTISEQKASDYANKFKPEGFYSNENWYWWIDLNESVRFNIPNDYIRLFEEDGLEEFMKTVKRNLNQIDIHRLLGAVNREEDK